MAESLAGEQTEGLAMFKAMKSGEGPAALLTFVANLSEQSVWVDVDKHEGLAMAAKAGLQQVGELQDRAAQQMHAQLRQVSTRNSY